MPKVLARGVRTHYQQLGSGSDLVLLHGLGANLAFWYLGVAPLLATDHRVTAYDLRGHGLSGRTPRGYTTGELAADLMAIMDRLDIEHAAVIGHSYGAAIALHAAVLHPGRIDRVVAADAYLPCFEPRIDAWRDARARWTRRNLRRRGLQVPPNLPKVAYGMLDELGRAPGRSVDDGVGALAWTSLERSADRWQRLRNETRIVPELYDASLSAKLLRRTQASVLATYGTRSTLSSASVRGLRSALPALDVVAMPDAGHLHPLVQPKQFADKVQPFLGPIQTTEVTR
jgi:pimeloyl-ACP methyl ester carboxylesterase